MVVFCIIGDDDDAPTRGKTGLMKLNEKLLTGLGVKRLLLSPVDKLTVANANGSEIPDGQLGLAAFGSNQSGG